MAANILLLILQHGSTYQQLLHIKLDANGQLEHSETFQRLAQGYVIVRLWDLAELAA